MPKYIIERDLPDADKLSDTDLQGIAQKSCDVLKAMGPDTVWQQSYVTGDKVYCVYIAPNEAAIRDHAERGGFPLTKIARVSAVIDPATAG